MDYHVYRIWRHHPSMISSRSCIRCGTFYTKGLLIYKLLHEAFNLVASFLCTKKIVDMMNTESLFASQGGPIILSQTCFFSCVLNIENEYGPESKSFGIGGHAYLNWVVQMALRLGTGRNQILLFYARFFSLYMDMD
ncbi:hypothetical protein ZIOFF_075718 [Zingiber officinale]|uniref:Uncharacterized protein n=1 Tax=Zingiber officinale TaxID=94328 RepID=A0A8J5ESH3_ZINOF|nr:hypothetical protein ZIOFF_075718 [Zingiber officinale]